MKEPTLSGPSFLKVLWCIQRNPEMYLGFSPAERSKQLEALEYFISGYHLAAWQHQCEDPGIQTYARLETHLAEKFGVANSGGGPIRLVLANSCSGEAAWKLFWESISELQEDEVVA